MLKQGVYTLKEDASPISEVNLQKGQELEVVNEVIYMNGFILYPTMQTAFNKWMVENKNLFTFSVR